MPYSEGSKLAELYALGPPIESRDRPRGRGPDPRAAPASGTSGASPASSCRPRDRDPGHAAPRRRRPAHPGLRRRRGPRPRRLRAPRARPRGARAGRHRHRGRDPRGHAGLVTPRSGLAAKHGITIVNTPGLVDSGYRGELRVILHNTDARETFLVEPGMRIAQLVVVAVPQAELREVEELPAERARRGRLRLVGAAADGQSSRASGCRRSCAGTTVILLCRHEKPGKEYWLLPGGGVELGRVARRRAAPRAARGGGDRRPDAVRGADRDRRLDLAAARDPARSTSSTSSSRPTSAGGRWRRSPPPTQRFAATGSSGWASSTRSSCTRRSSGSSPAGSPATRRSTSGRSGRPRTCRRGPGRVPPKRACASASSASSSGLEHGRLAAGARAPAAWASSQSASHGLRGRSGPCRYVPTARPSRQPSKPLVAVVAEAGDHTAERLRALVEDRPAGMVLEARHRLAPPGVELALEQDVADHPPLARDRVQRQHAGTGELRSRSGRGRSRRAAGIRRRRRGRPRRPRPPRAAPGPSPRCRPRSAPARGPGRRRRRAGRVRRDRPPRPRPIAVTSRSSPRRAARRVSTAMFPRSA